MSYLVESNVHFIHQVDVELADKFFQLLRISERLCPLHLITHNPYHCPLQARNTHSSVVVEINRRESPDKNNKKVFLIAISLIQPLTFICSLKVKYLPETLRPPITSAKMCSWLRFSGSLLFAPKNSTYCSETASNVLPTCL